MPYQHGLPFAPGSATSLKAAVGARPRAKTQRERIEDSLRARHAAGATCDELSLALGISNQSMCPRIRELHEQGRIAKLTIERQTRTGTLASVYVTPEFVVGRETVAFVRYRLVAVSLGAFEEAFAEYDPEWRARYWEKLETAAGRKPPAL